MNKLDMDIAHMQCSVFRMAEKKWKIPTSTCADLFEKYDLLGFIRDCYGLLHTSSYTHALSEIEEVLSANGVNLANFGGNIDEKSEH